MIQAGSGPSVGPVGGVGWLDAQRQQQVWDKWAVLGGVGCPATAAKARAGADERQQPGIGLFATFQPKSDFEGGASGQRWVVGCSANSSHSHSSHASNPANSSPSQPAPSHAALPGRVATSTNMTPSQSHAALPGRVATSTNMTPSQSHAALPGRVATSTNTTPSQSHGSCSITTGRCVRPTDRARTCARARACMPDERTLTHPAA
eukprot:365850-Chlamydomonas_euryale.AAC.7